MDNIKSINEFFDTSAFGDSYGDGGGNGIFKITYRPFKDLSVSVGPDRDIKRDVEGSEFAIGDLVIGVPVGEKEKKVAGMVVKSKRDPENKSYIIHVQVSSKKEKNGEKIMELKPDTIEHIDLGDKGHKQVISDFKLNLSPEEGNPGTAYTASELGIETIGG